MGSSIILKFSKIITVINFLYLSIPRSSEILCCRTFETRYKNGKNLISILYNFIPRFIKFAISIIFLNIEGRGIIPRSSKIFQSLETGYRIYKLKRYQLDRHSHHGVSVGTTIMSFFSMPRRIVKVNDLPIGQSAKNRCNSSTPWTGF